MTFRLIPPGRFTMGTGVDRDAPHREVTITRPFYLAETEMTRAQWEATTGLTTSDYFPGEKMPISYITSREIRTVLKKLRQGDKTRVYRLPTEAEWEYAARAGATGDGAEDLAKTAWIAGNAGQAPRPVAGLAPNAWGLYDMQGNVWEWCSDFYDPETYRFGKAVDPSGPRQTLYGYCVLRGGSALDPARAARAGNRAFYQNSRSNSRIGLRLVLEIPNTTAKEVK
jgi:formylglycine-generating enzyme required for sulfatase activity